MSDRSIIDGSRSPLRQAVARSVVVLGVTAGAWLAGSLANSAFADTPVPGAPSTLTSAVVHAVAPATHPEVTVAVKIPSVKSHGAAPVSSIAGSIAGTAAPAESSAPQRVARAAPVNPSTVARPITVVGSTPIAPVVRQEERPAAVPAVPHIAEPITAAAVPAVRRVARHVSPLVAPVAPAAAGARPVTGGTRPVTGRVLEAARPVVEPAVRNVRTLSKVVAPVLIPALTALPQPHLDAVTSELAPVTTALAPLLQVLAPAPTVHRPTGPSVDSSLPVLPVVVVVPVVPVVPHHAVTAPVTPPAGPSALAIVRTAHPVVALPVKLSVAAPTSLTEHGLSSRSADPHSAASTYPGAAVLSASTGGSAAIRLFGTAANLPIGAISVSATASVGTGHSPGAVRRVPAQPVAAPAVVQVSIDLPIVPLPDVPTAPAAPVVAVTTSPVASGSDHGAPLVADVESSAQLASVLFLMALCAATAAQRGRLADRPSFCPD